MFRKLRKINYEIPKERVEELIKTTEYGVLSTVGEDGYPYAVPVNYAYINGNIYFHCAREGHKLDNISFNNKVSFTFCFLKIFIKTTSLSLVSISDEDKNIH